MVNRMKRIIITGGSDGLGAELGRQCIADGIEVTCISRTAPDYPATHIACDLTDPDAIDKAADLIIGVAAAAPLDALVNCAGQMSVQSPGNISYAELEQTFRLNVLAPVYLTSRLFETLAAHRADIVNVGSTVGAKAYTRQMAYGASKWAMRGVSENWRLELKDRGCRVIQFNPGGFKSRIFEKATGQKPDLTAYMDAKPLAALLLFILKLPKSVEVSELLVNRK